MKTICIVGTFDTKGEEIYYIKEILENLDLNTYIVNIGVFESKYKADFTNRELLETIGESIVEIIATNDRAHATETLAKAIGVALPKLYEDGKFDGVIALGGSGGTSIATAGMRQLPVGVPKVMISTMASGQVSHYVGTNDIIMVPSIVDVAGINKISRQIFNNAAHAIAGMVKFEYNIEVDDKPLIAASMFGLTTPAVNAAMKYLEDRGYEVLVFHATGTGGKTMESLVEQSYFKGVLDLTTTEWCDELFDGVLHAGPHRLEAAGLNGIPQVVSLGAMDMVNFGPFDTIPEKYKGRNFYKHNPSVTLMRTSVEENKLLGEKIAEKLNLAKKDTVLMIPKKGLSGIDMEGKPFYGPEENKMLFKTLRENINNSVIKIVEMDTDINDKEFAERAAQELIAMIENK